MVESASFIMAITKVKIHVGQQPTEEQIKEIEMASEMPVTPDEDAPELTLEQFDPRFIKKSL